MKMKLERRNVVYCEYCRSFYESSVRESTGTKAEPIHKRLCSILERMVNREQSKCNKFKKTKLFWCEKNSFWLDLVCCPIRKVKGIEQFPECENCRQGRIIRKVLGVKRNPITRKEMREPIIIPKKREKIKMRFPIKVKKKREKIKILKFKKEKKYGN